MQEVSLDKKIKLLDSPGVVMDSHQNPVTAVLRNVVRLEALEDPVPPVEAILCRCSKEQVCWIVCLSVSLCLCLCIYLSIFMIKLLLRNILRLEALEDPVPPVEAILCRCSKEQVCWFVCLSLCVCLSVCWSIFMMNLLLDKVLPLED